MRDPEDRAAFGEAIGALTAAFQKEPTKPLLLGYWLGLRDLDLSTVQKAVALGIRDSKFMPPPAALREFAGDEPVGVRCVRAWDAVKRAIREHGAYQSISFDDPAVNAAIRSLGGWVKICSLDSEELDKWTRKDFEKVYSGFSQHGVAPESARYLDGLHEREARFNGYEAPKPKLITTGVAPAKLLGPVSASPVIGLLIELGDKKGAP